jgi:hypothetical protein
MKLFKDSNNTVYAYAADGSQDSLIGDKTAISQQEADALIAQKTTDTFNSLSYSEKRAAAYPTITDYVDGIVKNDQAQIDKYIADCLAVKAMYPKP